MAVMIGKVDSDFFWITFINQFGQLCPLIGLGIRIPGAFENFPDIITRYSQAFNFFICTAIKHHQHGGSACSKPRGRKKRADNRIFIVFATDDYPHIETFPTHKAWQYCAYTIFKQFINDFGLFALG